MQTSLNDIAHETGVTRGAIYWHFDNKADLLHQMLDQVRLPPEQMAQRIHSCDQEQPLRTLRDLCVEGISALANDQQKRQIMTILLHRCEFTEELAAAGARHHLLINQLLNQCEHILVRHKNMLNPGVTPRLAALSLHALIIGLFTDWTRSPESFDPDIDSAPLIDPLFRGLVKNWEIF